MGNCVIDYVASKKGVDTYFIQGYKKSLCKTLKLSNLYYKIKVTSVLVYGIIINMSVHLVSLFGIGEKYLWWKITAIFSQVLHLRTYSCLYFAFTCFYVLL